MDAPRRCVRVSERRRLRFNYRAMRTVMRCVGARHAVRRSTRFMLAEERLENLPQSAAPAKNARLHGANAAFKHFGDFVVTQSLEIAQNDGGAKDVGNFLQSLLHGNLNFSRSKLLE